MKLGRLFDTLIQFGKDCDPRGRRIIGGYQDSQLLFGNPRTDIKKILIGIDIEVPELLLADRIRQREGLDLVVSHHPEGRAFAELYEVMKMQADILIHEGIKSDDARELIDMRMREVERKLHAANHMRAVDAARLLSIPLLCVHTPADNHAEYFIKRLLSAHKPSRVCDIIDLLMAVPEYKKAVASGAGPKLLLGSKHRPVGKWFVDMTGGTEGPKDVFAKLYQKGIRTIIGMHLSEEHFSKAKDTDLNVIMAGHISSDAIGMNVLFDKVERIEPLEIIDCSGFTRVRRV